MKIYSSVFKKCLKGAALLVLILLMILVCCHFASQYAMVKGKEIFSVRIVVRDGASKDRLSRYYVKTGIGRVEIEPGRTSDEIRITRSVIRILKLDSAKSDWSVKCVIAKPNMGTIRILRDGYEPYRLFLNIVKYHVRDEYLLAGDFCFDWFEVSPPFRSTEVIEVLLARKPGVSNVI